MKHAKPAAHMGQKIGKGVKVANMDIISRFILKNQETMIFQIIVLKI